MSRKAINKLNQLIKQGENWFIALLKAISLWEGRERRYFIDGEAFDLLELAKSLCRKIEVEVPRRELEQFLCHGRPPLSIDAEEFRRLIGPVKYRAYLNYFYGVVVEKALQRAVEEEVKKGRRCLGLPEDGGVREEVFLSIYNATYKELEERFRRERGYRYKDGFDEREFLYWLFKYRIRNCVPEKVASDTKKGLQYLPRLGKPLFISL